jgi:hypothetical protein
MIRHVQVRSVDVERQNNDDERVVCHGVLRQIRMNSYSLQISE